MCCHVMWYDVMWLVERWREVRQCGWLRDVMSCHAMSCHVVWCDVRWCPVLWCVMWCDAMWCVMWCDAMWWDVLSCDVMWCTVMWCDLMWCNVMWSDAMAWVVMWLWCYVVGWWTVWQCYVLAYVMRCGCVMWWIGRWCAVDHGEPMTAKPLRGPFQSTVKPWDVKHQKTTKSSCHSTTTSYYKVYTMTQYYSVLQYHYHIHVTTTFPCGSRSTWNVQSIARSNLWDALGCKTQWS